MTDTGVSYPAIDRTVVSNPVGIGIAIGFGLAALFRLPISTATPIAIPIPKTLFKLL